MITHEEDELIEAEGALELTPMSSPARISTGVTVPSLATF